MVEDLFIPEELRQRPAWVRLNDQLEWYDRKSDVNQMGLDLPQSGDT